MTGEDEEYEEYDEEEWDDDEGELAPPTSLSVGLLALVPLLLAYELALGPGTPRISTELLFSRALAPLGEHADLVRLAGVAVLAVATALHAVRRGWRVVRSLLRTLVEGLVGAMLLGPVLVMLVAFLGDRVHAIVLPRGVPEDLPDLQRAALALGSGAWEELAFRLGLYTAVYFVVRRAVAFVRGDEDAGGWVADGAALVLSSAAFAAVHLDVVVSVLGRGGEPFHSGVFAWRAFAGAALAVLFRWRGVGVAGWAHGLFNVGLILGAGPAVFV